MVAYTQKENCTMWQIAQELSFGLITVDNDAVWVGIYDDGGALHAALGNTTNGAVEWAREVYEQYKRQADHTQLPKNEN